MAPWAVDAEEVLERKTYAFDLRGKGQTSQHGEKANLVITRGIGAQKIGSLCGCNRSISDGGGGGTKSPKSTGSGKRAGQLELVRHAM